MYFQHIYDKSLAQSSYLIGCQKTGESIVIDAKRDVDTYLQIAAENNLRITHITETHIHADFLSGTRELAKLTGAPMYLSDEGGPEWQYEFSHVGLRDGDVIKVGNLSLEVIHTPGHTPESIIFVLTDLPASNQPVMVFTGDFVFVGDVGRPDLLETAAGQKGTKEKSARTLYQSLEKFRSLPDFVQVWPGHGAGSACGKALGAVPSSTVGYEKIQNWALQFPGDEAGFVNRLLHDQPEPPRYFAMMKKLNKVARRLVTEIPALTVLSKDDFNKALRAGTKIIDTRTKETYAKGFIPGTINIPFNNSFSTWMGWLVNYDEPFILIAKKEQHEDIVRQLMRIGMEKVYGYVADVDQTDEPLATAQVVATDDVAQAIENNNAQIIDIRGASEYQSGHLAGASNLFLGTMEDNLHEIEKEKPVIIHCQSGARAAIGYSLLYRHGFRNIMNFSGGINAWIAAGKPLIAEHAGVYAER